MAAAATVTTASIIFVSQALFGLGMYSIEDSGASRVLEVPVDGEGALWCVRLVSYDETRQHPQIEAMKGKRITVTVTVEDAK